MSCRKSVRRKNVPVPIYGTVDDTLSWQFIGMSVDHLYKLTLSSSKQMSFQLCKPTSSKFVRSKCIRCSGLVVMGGDSCSNSREFESRHHLLDGYFFTYLCVFEKAKIIKKEAEAGPFLKTIAN